MKNYFAHIEFESIKESWTRVHISSERDKEIVRVRVEDGLVRYSNKETLISDIIDLAIAIHYADRFVLQNLNKAIRRIHVILPLRNNHLFSYEAHYQALVDLLFWCTETEWSFKFIPNKSKMRLSNIRDQMKLPFKSYEKEEVALWSGGLDSLLGLLNRDLKKTENTFYSLVGTGANDMMFGKQKKVRNSLPLNLRNRSGLTQVKFHSIRTDSISKNKFMRSRGIVFLFVGIAVALSKKQNKLHIYENGVGALNLPYNNSNLGLHHSRSVNPITLDKVAKYLSSIVNQNISVINPFLFQTKGNLVYNLIHKVDNFEKLIGSTFSCDSPHRAEISQCGYCTSCLLRRVSICANDIEDISEYNIDLNNKKNEKKINPLNHMLEQLRTLEKNLKNTDDHISWDSLTKSYPEVIRISRLVSRNEYIKIEIVRANFIRLFRTYVFEWNKVLAAKDIKFLESII